MAIWAGLGIGAAGLILIAIVASLTVRVAGRTLASRSLDTLGRHDLALGSDLMAKNGFSPILMLASSEYNQGDKCEDRWDSIKQLNVPNPQGGTAQLSDLSNPQENLSFLFQAGIKPVDAADQNNLNLSYNAEFVADQDQQAYQVDMDLKLKADLQNLANSSLNQLYQGTLGMTELDMNLRTLNKDQKNYTQIPRLNLTTPDKNLQGDLGNNWYVNQNSPVNTVTEPQSQAQKDAQAAWYQKHYKNDKLEQVVSQPTGEAILKYLCSGVQEIQIQNITEVTFGQGDKARSKQVRPIQIKMKDDFVTIYTEGLQTLLPIIGQDTTLKNYGYSKYQAQVELNQILDRPSVSEEQHRKDVDRSLSQMVDSGNSPDLEQTVSFLKENLSFKGSTTTYLSADNQEVYAQSNQLTLIPSQALMSQLDQQINAADSSAQDQEALTQLRDILARGMSFQADIYDINSGSKAAQITELPGNQVKNSDDLLTDIIETELGREITSDLQQPQTQNSDFEDQFQEN